MQSSVFLTRVIRLITDEELKTGKTPGKEEKKQETKKVHTVCHVISQIQLFQSVPHIANATTPHTNAAPLFHRGELRAVRVGAGCAEEHNTHVRAPRAAA